MIVDLFAGVGGWAQGLRSIGLQEIGLELDRNTCRSRAAAGHRTIRADVASCELRISQLDGLIGSPPCQSFSRAGKRKGLDDPRGQLIWQPVIWAERYRPRWIALEQVPDVLDVWRLEALRLNELGYSTWAGTLHAECYGVPQTRERAFLLASLEGAVRMPEPTHQKYVPGVGAGATHEPGLFGDIITHPWVSMAEAIPTVVDRLLSTGRDWKKGKSREESQTIPTTRPAPTVTSVESQWQWIYERPATVVCGDRRIFNPGHHANADYPGTGSRNDGAVRVTVQEQLVLQGFPADYPVQGGISSQYQQVGNAVPPPVAAAVVGALSGAV